jgi:hypothetical protein
MSFIIHYRSLTYICFRSITNANIIHIPQLQIFFNACVDISLIRCVYKHPIDSINVHLLCCTYNNKCKKPKMQFATFLFSILDEMLALGLKSIFGEYNVNHVILVVNVCSHVCNHYS